MKVKLLQNTNDPLRLMYAQTRGTTTSDGFDAVWDNPFNYFPKKTREALSLRGITTPYSLPSFVEKNCQNEMIRLVDEALNAGHLSVTRGVTFTFSISCARSTGRQMLRHVVGVAWEEMSQRYVKLLNRKWVDEFRDLISEYKLSPKSLHRDMLIEHMSQIFEVPKHINQPDVEVVCSWAETRLRETEQYLNEIASGVPAEDARENLPNCTRTEMICTMGFEALKTFLAKRLCTRAQEPIREAAKQMRKQVVASYPWMGKHLMVQCLPACICPESRPDGCPLLAENGGNVLRKEQAYAAIKQAVKTFKESR